MWWVGKLLVQKQGVPLAYLPQLLSPLWFQVWSCRWEDWVREGVLLGCCALARPGDGCSVAWWIWGSLACAS